MIYIRPYSKKSHSAYLLWERLGKKWAPRFPNSTLHLDYTDVVVNWGSSKPLDPGPNIILNRPEMVTKAVNKKDCFKSLLHAGITVPHFTSEPLQARDWLLVPLSPVVCRSLVCGSKGKGITIAHSIPEFEACNNAKFWTLYVHPTSEFRVYVFRGEVLAVLKKRRKKAAIEAGIVNEFIRTHKNGWVFCKENVKANRRVSENAAAAVHCLGLDFGGVDVVWNKEHQKAYVLEVNTAPGITKTNVQLFADAIKQYADKLTGC